MDIITENITITAATGLDESQSAQWSCEAPGGNVRSSPGSSPSLPALFVCSNLYLYPLSDLL